MIEADKFMAHLKAAGVDFFCGVPDSLLKSFCAQYIVAKSKADSEAPSLHGHLHIGESAFEQAYGNRFRLILQGVELYYQKMVKYAE